MNQNLKRIVVWILLAGLLIGIVPVAALTAFAEHTYAPDESWASNSTHHWHPCTESGCTEHPAEGCGGYAEHTKVLTAVDAAAHTYRYACACGWEDTETVTAYIVTFETAHGTAPAAATVKESEAVSAPTTPTAEGWRFEAWEKDGQEWDFGTEITEDVTLTAKWTQVCKITASDEKITVAPNAAEGETVTFTVTPADGYAVDTVTVTPDTTVEEGESSYSFVMPAEDVAISATYKLARLTMTPASVPVIYPGQTVTLTANPLDASKVTWQSSDETVATVADGVVTAVAKGDAVITATAKESSEIKATCAVHVAELSFAAESKTVSGKKGLAIDSTALEVTLSEGKLVTDGTKFTASNVAVSNLPAGVSYTVAPKAGNEKAIVLTFSGTPTEAKDGALQIAVSRELVENAPAGDPVTVSANANAKWEIKNTHTVTVTAIASAHGSVSLFETRSLYASGETVTVVPAMKAPFTVKAVTVTPAATVTKTAAGYTFPMGDSDVTVTVEVGIDTLTTDIAEKSHVGSISITDAAGLAEAIRTGSSSVKVNATLTDSQKTAISAGRYSFKFTVTNSKSTTDNSALRNQAVTSDGMHLVYNGYNDLTYFDISLTLTAYRPDGTVEGAVIGVTDTGSYKVTVTFPGLDKSPAKRLYYVHSGHNVADYLSQSASSTNGNVVFDNLTQFSTYTLVRTTVDSPQTADRFPLELLLTLFFASATGLIAVAAMRRGKE